MVGQIKKIRKRIPTTKRDLMSEGEKGLSTRIGTSTTSLQEKTPYSVGNERT